MSSDLIQLKGKGFLLIIYICCLLFPPCCIKLSKSIGECVSIKSICVHLRSSLNKNCFFLRKKNKPKGLEVAKEDQIAHMPYDQ